MFVVDFEKSEHGSISHDFEHGSGAPRSRGTRSDDAAKSNDSNFLYPRWSIDIHSMDICSRIVRERKGTHRG